MSLPRLWRNYNPIDKPEIPPHVGTVIGAVTRMADRWGRDARGPEPGAGMTSL